MRTIFIGDVHGMLDTLDTLLHDLAPGPGDTLIFLGDLVDKGPDQLGVVRRVGELQARSEFTTHLLRGNHEDKHIRYRARLQDRPSVARKMGETSPSLVQFHDAATDDDWQVLLNALPFWRHPERGLLAVHGGIPGDMWNFPHHWDEVTRMERRDQRHVEKIWRTRYLDKETGVFLANDHIQPGDPFWAEIYDGRFGHVIFGHEVFMKGPGCFPHATGIDTGAVHGGALTALILDANDRRQFLSAPGTAYCRNQMEEDA